MSSSADVFISMPTHLARGPMKCNTFSTIIRTRPMAIERRILFPPTFFVLSVFTRSKILVCLHASTTLHCNDGSSSSNNATCCYVGRSRCTIKCFTFNSVSNSKQRISPNRFRRRRTTKWRANSNNSTNFSPCPINRSPDNCSRSTIVLIDYFSTIITNHTPQVTRDAKFVSLEIFSAVLESQLWSAVERFFDQSRNSTFTGVLREMNEPSIYTIFTASQYSANTELPVRSIEPAYKQCFDEVVRTYMEEVNRIARNMGRFLEYKKTLYGYYKHEPRHGMKYILDLFLIYRKYSGKKMSVSESTARWFDRSNVVFLGSRS